jgi:hypothetical protein
MSEGMLGSAFCLGREVVGNADELVHAGIAKLVELVPDGGLVADPSPCP